MAGSGSARWLRVLLVATAVAAAPAVADPSLEAQLLERLQRLEQNQAELLKQQGELRQQLKEKDERLDALEAELQETKQAAQPGAAPAAQAPATVAIPATEDDPTAFAPTPPPAKAPPSGAVASKQPTPPVEAVLDRVIGTYEQGKGFGLARTQWGEVNFGIYTYLRYLNQKGLDDTFTNGLGDEVKIDKRDDLELNKVKLEFRGWLIDPHFRYTLYTWTNNAAQGLGAQVVVGGNLNWRFGPELTVGGGILSLPTTRSTQGNFPYWLTVDHRTIADEFFRGSYSQGFYGYGEKNGFGYFAMLANNLSTLGVDAGQTDGDFTTASGALWWMPTTGEYGPKQGFGDYEHHENLATRLGVHFTFSPEDRQSQPGTEDIDNTQIRLSNGTIVFTPGALAPDVRVNNVKYYMADFDAGMKYRGFALEGEYYWRWLNDFRADGPLPVDSLFDHGFQVQVSQMVLPKTVQLYAQGSYIFGDRGDAWETTAGLNFWVFRRRELRLNLEYIYDHQSPIGYTAVPQVVGGTGSIFNMNLEMSF